MLAGIIQRYPVLLSHFPDAVENRVPVSEQLRAGLLQRMMTAQICVQREAVFRIFLPVMPPHCAHRGKDQVPPR